MVSGLEFRGLQNFRLRFKGFTAGGFGFEAIGFPGWGWRFRVCKCWARDLAFEFTVGFGGGLISGLGLRVQSLCLIPP